MMAHATDRHPFFALALAIALTAGCDGVLRLDTESGPVTTPSESPYETPTTAAGRGGGAGGEGAAPSSDETEPGLSYMARLTHVEYENSLDALFPFEPEITVELPRETSPEGFSNQAASQSVSPLLMGAYVEVAEHVSAQAVAGMDDVVGCDPTDEACLRNWVRSFGARAFRRPLTDAEVDELVAVHGEVAGEHGSGEGVQTVVQAVLLSPQFLYRVEPGAPGDPLDPHSMAARLSYLFWDAPPDEQLLAAADAGELETTEQVEAQARRLLADGRARSAIARFFVEWLGVSDVALAPKDSATYEAWTSDVANATLRETEAFVSGHVFDGDGSYRTLLTSPTTWVDTVGAESYGTDVPDDGAVHRIDRNEDHAGMLTLPAVMATHGASTHSNPIGRGKFVRTKLLCQTLPEPPDDVTTEIEVSNEPSSAREQLAIHRADPSCAGCHELLEPVGFAFEAFDGIGRYRGPDVDTSGELVQAGSAGGEFVGASELARMLADSDVANACLVQKAFEYAMGRPAEPGEQPTLDSLYERFETSGGHVPELFVAITTTPQFRSR